MNPDNERAVSLGYTGKFKLLFNLSHGNKYFFSERSAPPSDGISG